MALRLASRNARIVTPVVRNVYPAHRPFSQQQPQTNANNASPRVGVDPQHAGKAVSAAPSDSAFGVWVVRLQSPKTMNALTVNLGEQFQSVIEDLKKRAERDQQSHARGSNNEQKNRNLGADKTAVKLVEMEEETQQPEPPVRAVIVTGDTENRAFSAGGDLSFLEARCEDAPAVNSPEMRRFYARFLSIRSLPVPTIAAINGPAVGAGFCLAMACDFRIAARKARVGVNFAPLGIHPGMACTHHLPQLVGPQEAARLMLTGELISADEAARIGLLLRVVDDAEDVLHEAILLAAKMSVHSSPLATQLTVETLRRLSDDNGAGLAQALAREADAQALCYAAGDLRRGIAAVKTKRPVHYGPDEAG